MQGKGTGVITDINGNFTIVADPNQPLTVSYIGFDSQQVKAGNKNNLKIYLKESSIALNEIVVVGYGSQSEKLVTTSISSLKVDDLDQGSDYNVAKMLQGRTPGVNVASASGTPVNNRVYGYAVLHPSQVTAPHCMWSMEFPVNQCLC